MIKKNKFFIISLLIIGTILFFAFPDRTFIKVIDGRNIFAGKKVRSFRVCFDGINQFAYRKKNPGKWIIESPLTGEADSRSIEQFLKRLSNLSLDSPVSIKESSHVDFELTDETEFIEILEEKKEKFEKLLIGKENGGLLYVRMNLEKEVYTVNSDLISNVPDLEDSWLNRQILSYKKGEIVEIIVEDSDYQRTEIQIKDSRWKINGHDADQYQIEFMIAGLVNFRADKFLKPGIPLPEEKGKIKIKSKNGDIVELEILFLPNNDYLVKHNNSIFYLYNYRLKSFFNARSEFYSRETLRSLTRIGSEIKLDHILKEAKRTDIKLTITRPASDNTLFMDDKLNVQYGAVGISLSKKSGNYVVFIIDDEKVIIRERGLSVDLTGLSDGCHLIVGVICNQYGAIYRNSFTRRYFFVNKETPVHKTPYIKIISPMESINASSGKVLVDFVINDISGLESYKLFYFINNTKISLPSMKPFILENIPPAEITLKLQLEDKAGVVVDSDSKKLRFK